MVEWDGNHSPLVSTRRQLFTKRFVGKTSKWYWDEHVPVYGRKLLLIWEELVNYDMLIHQLVLFLPFIICYHIRLYTRLCVTGSNQLFAINYSPFLLELPKYYQNMTDKMKNLLIAVLTVGFLILLFEALGWFGPMRVNAATQQREAACDEIQHAYADLLYRVWIDNPSYVEDVLCECDEWCDLYELVGDEWISHPFKSVEDSLMYESNSKGSITYDPTCINWIYIPDSTYRKLRQVFPDLPAEQAPKQKLKHVEPITLQ